MLPTSHRALLGTSTALLAVTLLVGSPHAQPAAPTSAEGSAFAVTPYLWAAGMDGKGGAGGLPPADVTRDFGDILEKRDMAVMLFLDGRVGRFGAFADIGYLKLSADADPPRGVLFDDLDVDIT